MDTRKLRQKILDLAIRGKLVPQDPNDEPASVLLERIRAEKQRLVNEGKIKAPRASKTSDTSRYGNVPFDLPAGWVWVDLKQLCLFLSRGKSPKYSLEDRRYPVFAQKCNLKEGGISLEKAQFLDPTTIQKWPDVYRLKNGDVLVNSTGTGTVGRTRLFSESCLGKYPFVVPDSHISVIRTFDDIDSAYIFAVVSSPIMQTYIYDNLAGSTNQKELYIGVLENLNIPLPPHNEQSRIVVEVDKWFSAINTLESESISLDETIAKTKSKILDLAISGKLVPQDPTDEPAIELLKRINPAFKPCDNPHYENLPKGWIECSLKDAVDIQNGFAFKSSLYSSNGVRVIRITNVQDSHIVDDSPRYYPLSKVIGLEEYMLKENDLLMSLTGNVGRVAMMPANLLPAVLNQRVCCIKPKSSEVSKEFLFFLLRTDYFLTSCIGSSKGVAQLNVSTEWLKSYRIALPPKNEQQRIVRALQKIMDSLDVILAGL